MSKSRYQLDERVENFVSNVLHLPDWEGLDADEGARPSLLRWITEEIVYLNDAMRRADKQLDNIVAETERLRTGQYWPAELIGGGSWLTTHTHRYDNALAEVTRRRDLVMRIVVIARAEGLLPIYEERS